MTGSRPAFLLSVPLGTRLAVFGLGYFLLAELGTGMTLPGSPFATYWPAAGLFLAALLLHPQRIWPWFLLAALPGNLLSDFWHQRALAPALCYYAANALEALAGAFLVRRCAARGLHSDHLRRFLCLLVFAAGLSTCLGASVGATATVLFHGGDSYFRPWLSWWAADVLGVLSLAPAVLAWSEAGIEDLRRSWRRRGREAVLIGSATAVLGWLVSTNTLFPSPQIDSYLLLPVLGWALVRLGPAGVSVTMLVLTLACLRGFGQGAGDSVASSGIGLSLSSVHVYLLSTLSTLMLLSESLAERRAVMRTLRAMLDNMPYLAWFKDASGRYLAVNKAFARFLDLRPEHILGRRDEDILPRQRAERVWADDQATMASGRQFFVEERLTAPDGRDIWHETFRAPLLDEDGAVTGTTGLSRDFTSRKRLEEELVRSKVAAEDANQAKSDFLASMSHEIRAPLSGIMGALRLALLDELSPRQRELLDMSLDTADSLLGIVNDILDVARIEARRFELSPADFNLPEVLQRLLNPFALQAEHKGLALCLTMAPDVPHDLHGDAERLGQVVRNLVGNAIKFTRQGAVSLAVSRKDGLGQAHELHFSVTDTGIGIPEDKIPYLFRTFSQVHSESCGQYGGSGLGLAISKSLVELMGGILSVRSQPGEGSTFSFTAWFPEAAGAGDGREWCSAETIQAAPLPPLRLLVADDTRLSRMFVAHFLAAQGHTVAEAGNGQEVLAALERERFDAVIMDVRMPEMDGIQATARIRVDRSGRFDPRIPIIALTAHAMKGDRERFMAAGMDDYVSKPVDLDELFAVLRRVVVPQSLDGGLGGLSLDSGPPRVQVLDEAVIRRRFAGNRSFWVTLLRELTSSQLPEDRALLRQALQAGDETGVRRLAHKTKGCCGTVGATLAFEAARDLETAVRERMPELVARLDRELEALCAAVQALKDPAASCGVSERRSDKSEE